MNHDNFENVADSTDWLSTPLSGLSAVEAALRCQICKDFYKTPMLTSCNHTFCSLCIRRALSTDGKCPLCRASEQEMKLRSNWSMEEVVAAFTHTRAAVLDFAQRPPTQSASISTSPEVPKRKAPANGIGDDEVNEQQLSKRLRTSARPSKSKGMEATAEMARQEAHIPDPEPEPETLEPNDGLVACPICWKRMKEQLVDRHIETSCPGIPQSSPQKPSRASKPTSITSAFTSKNKSNNSNSNRTINSSSSSSTSPSRFRPTTTTNSSKPPLPTPDRLPALNYSMLREAQLRKELSEQGLSTSGNRGMLERRHREWVMIWNANCDSQRPRRRAELLHDLDVWERTLGSRASTTTSSSRAGAQIRDKDFDGAAWAARHDTSFKDLIANARRTRAQAQAQTQTQNSADDSADNKGRSEGGVGGEEGQGEGEEKGKGNDENISPPLVPVTLSSSDIMDIDGGLLDTEMVKKKKKTCALEGRVRREGEGEGEGEAAVVQERKEDLELDHNHNNNISSPGAGTGMGTPIKPIEIDR